MRNQYPFAIILRISLFVAVTLSLSACGVIEAGQKIFEVVKDPEIQVGDDSGQVSTLEMVFFAQQDANRNTLGEDVPVSVLVIEMTGDSIFKSSEIFEFLEDPKQALGSQFVSSAEHTVPPDKFLALPPVELNKKTKFIGVVGLFSEVEDIKWRDLAPVEPEGKVYITTVEIEKGSIAMQLEER